MAFPNNGRTVGMNRNPDPGDVDRQERAAIFAGEDAFGIDGLPAPAVESEDPIGLHDGVLALEIGQLPSIGLPGADMTAIGITLERLYLFY